MIHDAYGCRISEYIRFYRHKYGLTIRQLAILSGVDHATIAGYERETRTHVTFDTLEKIANSLGCKVHVTLRPFQRRPKEADIHKKHLGRILFQGPAAAAKREALLRGGWSEYYQTKAPRQKIYHVPRRSTSGKTLKRSRTPDASRPEDSSKPHESNQS